VYFLGSVAVMRWFVRDKKSFKSIATVVSEAAAELITWGGVTVESLVLFIASILLIRYFNQQNPLIKIK